MDNEQFTIEEFGQSVKLKYPQYSGLSDQEIGEKTLQKFPEYQTRIKADTGFIADIKSIGTGIKESANRRVDNFQDIQRAEQAGEQDAGRSLLQKIGQGAGFASDILGETFIGAVKALTPQSIQEPVGEAIQTGVQKLAETETAKKIADYYANLEPEKQRDLDAFLGVVSLGTDLAGGALLKKPLQKGVKQVIDKSGRVIDVVAETGKEAIQTVAKKTKGVTDVIAPVTESISNIPRRLQTNIDANRVVREEIRQLPTKTSQKAVQDGIDILDVQLINKVPKAQKPAFKKLAETVKKFEAGETKINPIELVGKPIVSRLKKLDVDVKKFGAELGKVAESLKGKSIKQFDTLSKQIDDGLESLGITKVKLDDTLDFVGSNIEGLGTANESVIKNVYKRFKNATDANDLHRLKKFIDENVDFGKSAEGFTRSTQNLLKSWRRQIDTALDESFPVYKKVNDELASRLSPLKDMKKLMKGIDPDSGDLLEMSAGLLARRLTSNAVSNPKIRQILRKLDSATKTKGKTTLNTEQLQDFYNLLEKYYDISAKTGFKGQIKGGIEQASNLQGIVIDKFKQIAGQSEAVRKKALEDLFAQIFGK